MSVGGILDYFKTFKAEQVSLLVSVIAIVFSALALFPEWIKPFRASVYDGGRVRLFLNPYAVPRREILISANLLFRNSGVATGVVQNVALALAMPNGGSAVYRAFMVNTDRTLNFGKDGAPLHLETFVGFEIAGQSSVAREIVFSGAPDTPSSPFLPGSYRARVFTNAEKEDEWQEHSALDFSVDAADIDALMQSTAFAEGVGFRVNLMMRDKPTGRHQRSVKALANVLARR